jgi:hypothetical protein
MQQLQEDMHERFPYYLSGDAVEEKKLSQTLASKCLASNNHSALYALNP